MPGTTSGSRGLTYPGSLPSTRRPVPVTLHLRAIRGLGDDYVNVKCRRQRALNAPELLDLKLRT